MKDADRMRNGDALPSALTDIRSDLFVTDSERIGLEIKVLTNEKTKKVKTTKKKTQLRMLPNKPIK